MGLKNLICANGVMIACYVIDALLILGAVGLFLWYYLKNAKTKKPNNRTNENEQAQTSLNDGIEKINDDTYVVANEEQEIVPQEPIIRDNAIEHFANQITDINEESNSELNANAVVVNHEVEQPVKKIPKKDEIENFVMIGGVKKPKAEKDATLNRGTNAFKNSTNFLNAIKEEQTVKEKSTTSAKKKTTK